MLAAGAAFAQVSECTAEKPDLPGCYWPSREPLAEQLERSKRLAPQMQKDIAKTLRNAPPPSEPDLSYAYTAEHADAEMACQSRLPRNRCRLRAVQGNRPRCCGKLSAKDGQEMRVREFRGNPFICANWAASRIVYAHDLALVQSEIRGPVFVDAFKAV